MRRGIYAATLTPVTPALDPDAGKAIPYYRDLLARGCDGLNILGTTGEAMSFSVEQRIAFMKAIASALPPDRISCGTGAAALADAVRLTQAAMDLNFAAALIMPPFFYRDVEDDGIVAFFDAFLSRVQAIEGRIVLYNFPRMSGITFHAGLVDRLMREFPGTIIGMKDSSNDRALQRELLQRHEGFLVYPGSEHYLVGALSYGAAGCISGSVCLWPELAQEVYKTRDAAKGAELARLRGELDGRPLIPAVRATTAATLKDQAWEKELPPLAPPGKPVARSDT